MPYLCGRGCFGKGGLRRALLVRTQGCSRRLRVEVEAKRLLQAFESPARMCASKLEPTCCAQIPTLQGQVGCCWGPRI
jgi:hypothetical protein